MQCYENDVPLNGQVKFLVSWFLGRCYKEVIFTSSVVVFVDVDVDRGETEEEKEDEKQVVAGFPLVFVSIPPKKKKKKK